MENPHILPDLLPPGLALVVCGTAPGTVSAQRGAYYAGPGNKFWPMLHRLGLTPRLMAPAEFPALPAYGIGLTDVVKTAFGADSVLPRAAFDGAGLAARIAAAQPAILAFNGVRAARAFYGRQRGVMAYGRQPAVAGMPAVFVLPSTSGLASRFWDDKPWFEMAAAVVAQRGL